MTKNKYICPDCGGEGKRALDGYCQSCAQAYLESVALTDALAMGGIPIAPQPKKRGRKKKSAEPAEGAEPEPAENAEPVLSDYVEVTVNKILDQLDILYTEEGTYYRKKNSQDRWRPGLKYYIAHQSWISRLIVEKPKPKLSTWINESVIGVQAKIGIPLERFPEPPIEQIPFSNGVYNWKTGEFHEGFDVDHYFRKTLAVEYIPGADPGFVGELFNDWVGEARAPDLYQLIGLCFLQGFYPVKKFFLLVGNGDDGKSTFIRVIQAILGKGNYSSSSPQDLTGERKDRFAGADLYQKFANINSDIPYSTLTDLSDIKQLTGGDEYRAQFKGQHAFEFRNYATMIFSCNQIMKIRDKASGAINRFRIIDFPNTIPADRRDPGLSDKIKKARWELAGVAQLAIHELRRLAAENWKLSGDITTEEMAENIEMRSDPIQYFLDHCCLQVDQGGCLVKEFSEKLALWVHQQEIVSEKQINSREINYTLKRNGFSQGRDRYREWNGQTWEYKTGPFRWGGLEIIWSPDEKKQEVLNKDLKVIEVEEEIPESLF